MMETDPSNVEISVLVEQVEVTSPDEATESGAKGMAIEPMHGLPDEVDGALLEATSWLVEECTDSIVDSLLLADELSQEKSSPAENGGGAEEAEQWQLPDTAAADSAAAFGDFYGAGTGSCSSDEAVTLSGDAVPQEHAGDQVDSSFMQADFTDFYGEQSLVSRGRVLDVEEDFGRSVCSTAVDGLSSESSVVLSDGEDAGLQGSESTISLEAWTTQPAPSVSPQKLEEALEIAAQCAAAEEGGLGDWEDNIWDQLMSLWPMLSFAAQQKFAPPPGFLDAMDTCAKSLLQAPENCLRNLEQMVEMLDSSITAPLLSYLDCLEAAMIEAPRSSSSYQEEHLDSKMTLLSQRRVQRTLGAWSTEHALLQVSAAALWEVLMAHGPIHHSGYSEWGQAMKAREALQTQQEDVCLQIAKDLEEAATLFGRKVDKANSESLPSLANNSRSALIEFQEFSTQLMERQKASLAGAQVEYEALNAKAEACRAVVSDARQEVQRHTRSFSLVVQRFSKVARRLLSWKSTLVPKLRLLELYHDDMRKAAHLRQKIRALNKEYLIAGDDIDAAQLELRKCKRHTQGGVAALAVEAAQSRVTRAVEYARLLMDRLQESKINLQEAEDAIPMKIEAEEMEDDSEDACTGDVFTPRSDERLTPSIIQLAQRASMQVAEAEAERDRVLQQLAERDEQLAERDEQLAEQLAERAQVEADLMCPIMHERMREPVLAADGHTYERAAIERWMQSHDTSPMTGAPLTHRYLTQNFALRRVISVLDTDEDPHAVQKEGVDHEDHCSESGDFNSD